MTNMAEKRRRVGTVDPPNSKKLRLSDNEDQEIWAYLKMNEFPDEVWSAFKGKTISKVCCGWIRAGKVGDQIDVLRQLAQIAIPSHNDTVFNDPIHGHIELHPLLMKIVDTPQFQRLRYIKQLGGGYYVFPGASHNRFEHSIGHLAGEFAKCIQERQPELMITDNDILCVRIAGLCHDLGHGPLSHMFDSMFIKRVNPESSWKHEDGSIAMLDHLIHTNNLWSSLEDYGLNLKDVVFIKELIYGPLPDSELSCQDRGLTNDRSWPYKGRDRDKRFLYEIVANKRTGIDVDKWDYLARDCHCLGIPNNFDWKRYMKFTKVLEVDGEKQICIRDKEVNNLYEMFHTRTSLHRRAYQHKTSNIIELMITEALVLADNYFLIEGENGHKRKISECINDMVAFTKLTDNVLHSILYSTEESLAPARQLLERIQKRELYKHVGQTQPSTDMPLDKEDVLRGIMCCIGDDSVKEDDLVIQVVTFDYGMKNRNPIDHMRFYTKTRPFEGGRVHRDQVSSMLPHTFTEQVIRVYCKEREICSIVYKGFVEWCTRQDHTGLLPMDDVSMATPYATPFGTPAKEDNSTDSSSSSTAKRGLTF